MGQYQTGKGFQFGGGRRLEVKRELQDGNGSPGVARLAESDRDQARAGECGLLIRREVEQV